MIGLGYYDTITPPVIRRNVLENPAWYTAYTPYQPEISQGRLEALLNFQTMVEDLTALPVAGASLLDEGTAAAEAMALAHRAARAGGTFVVDADVFPQTLDVIRTRATPIGIDVVVHDLSTPLPAGDVFGVLVQYPGASGVVRDLAPLVAAAHERGALVAVAADLLALTLLMPPGDAGADIAVGTTQRFGVPLGFGGPHAGYLSIRAGLERQLPGRLVGVSVDADGKPAYRLALQTREQHIRREKATSNICTAQVLLAVIASMYAVYHGPDGLRRIAARVHRLATVLAAGLREGGVALSDGPFFDTLTAKVPGRAAAVVAAACSAGVNLRFVDDDTIAIAVDEATERGHVVAVWAAFGLALGAADIDRLDTVQPNGVTDLPAALVRTSPYLAHPVFSSHHSETSMLRYLRRLADRDYALDRGMIPLGSCTMKLNATTEMEPISLAGFARVHPFAPADQFPGYTKLFGDLQAWLAEITGYDAVSLQPNAGSQGEFAGLLAIANYHRKNGDTISRRLPHPGKCPRHERGQRRDGGPPGRRRQDRRRAGRDRSRRPRGKDRGARRFAGRDHGHLSVDARCVRGAHRRGLRARARRRRSGLRRRCEPERDGRSGPSRQVRCRRVAPEPAQDLLYPAWWRRPWRRADRRAGTSRALSAEPPAAGERRPGHRKRRDRGSPLGLGVDPAHQLGLRADDGRGWADRRNRGSDPVGELRCPPARRLLPDALHRCEEAWSPTSASSICDLSPPQPVCRSTTSRSG